MWEVVVKDAVCNGARKCCFSTRHAAEHHKALYKEAIVRRWTA